MNIKKGLTQFQQEELNTLNDLDKTFDANTTQTNSYKPLKSEAALLKANIKTINDATIHKIIDGTSDTDKKNALKAKTAIFWGNTNFLLHGFALKYGFIELGKSTKQTRSMLEDIADNNFEAHIEVLHTEISSYLLSPGFVDYGITATMLDAGLVMAKDFQGFLGTNKHTEGRSIVATDEVERLFLPAKGNYTQIELLSEYFSPDGPAPDELFYKALKTALVITHTNVHTIFDGYVYIAGTQTPIKGAQIKNLKNGRIVETDLLGYFKMEKFAGGLIEFEISAPGFVTLKPILELKTGKHLNLDYYLIPSA